MKPMTTLREGESSVVEHFNGGIVFCRKLRTLGLREGKTVTLVTYHPLGGPVVVNVDGRQITLGRGMASRVLVR